MHCCTGLPTGPGFASPYPGHSEAQASRHQTSLHDAHQSEEWDMPNNRRTIARLLAAAGLVLCLCARSIQAAATPHYSVDVWATDKGLPQSTVTSVIQTHDGYLWLGTLGGLVRFDGVQFKVFDETTTAGLNSSRVVHLFEDSRSNLWVGTETAGIALVKNGAVTNLEIGRGSHREGRLAAALQDSAGAVWLCTANGLLGRYQEKMEVWRIPVNPGNNWVGLVPDQSGLVWFGTERVLMPSRFASSVLLSSTRRVPARTSRGSAQARPDCWPAGGGQWRLADGRVERWTAAGVKEDWGSYPWTNAIVRAGCEDPAGNLVVGTYGAGVFWFNGPGHASCISTNEGLSNNHVLALDIDREGSLWVGTDGGGLDRVKRKFFEPVAPSAGLTVRSGLRGCSAKAASGSARRGDGLDYWRDGVLMHPRDAGRQNGHELLRPGRSCGPRQQHLGCDRSRGPVSFASGWDPPSGVGCQRPDLGTLSGSRRPFVGGDAGRPGELGRKRVEILRREFRTFAGERPHDRR